MVDDWVKWHDALKGLAAIGADPAAAGEAIREQALSGKIAGRGLLKYDAGARPAINGRIDINRVLGWTPGQPFNARIDGHSAPITEAEWQEGRLLPLASAIRLADYTISEIEIHADGLAEMIQLAGVHKSFAKVALGRPPGRPRKWDWDGMYVELIRLANMPDGLPEPQVDIERLVAQWFINTVGDQPTEGDIRERIGLVYKAIRGGRK